MGMVTVETDGRTAVEFGPDYSRHANEGENSTLELQANAEYLTGDHVIGFGYAYSETDIYNLFVQNALGSWEFDSVEDFRNREASTFYYAGNLTGDINDAAANFTQGTHALYVQDTWTPTWDLELTFGVRYERVFADDQPVYNPLFEERYGFKCQLTDDTRVRGGVGRYGGGRPNVWISNSYTNNGMTFSQFDKYLSNVPWSDFEENVDPTQVPQSVQDGLISDGYVNAIDPNFDLPSDWRASLGQRLKLAC